jgi:hypothetical protein
MILLIASEGDERLSQLADYADLAAILCAASVLLSIVLLLAHFRTILEKKTAMHVLLNLTFFLSLLCAAAVYYGVYLLVDPLFVRVAVDRRMVEAHIRPPSNHDITELARQRAHQMLRPPEESGFFHPGWPARFAPHVLIPSSLLARQIRHRTRRPPSTAGTAVLR